MRITVIGTGYVGLVTETCMAEVGNEVLCVDVDSCKIDILKSGGIPIYDPVSVRAKGFEYFPISRRH